MKKGLAELVFILDKSGSMGGLEKDTIGGYNSMLEKQKTVTGEGTITTVLFDNSYQLLHDRIDIRAVSTMTEKDYCVGGSTALLDAIGRTIRKISNAQKNTAEDFRAEKVLFVIITDGEENSSREYSMDHIKQMIDWHKTHESWEFIFLGANMDTAETAGQLGISPDRAQNYHADSIGVAGNFCVMSNTLASFRENKAIPGDWNADIEKDFQRRKKQK
jgi:uncharacterized protein YegL